MRKAAALCLLLAACEAPEETLDETGDGGGTDAEVTDVDGDGFDAPTWGGDDCDDADASVYPGAEEVWDDGIDQDCSGADTRTWSGTIALAPVDVLLVIDDSASMGEEQQALSANMPALVLELDNAGLDWHIGLVTTDMVDGAKAGRLQQHAGSGNTVISAGPNAVQQLAELVAATGTLGDADEAGRAAIYEALTTHASGANAGFARPEAHLATIVLSDENDYSGDTPISLADFITWYSALRPAGTSFHTIVGPDPVCPSAAEAGLEYIAVRDAVGGVHVDVCAADYSMALQGAVAMAQTAAPMVIAGVSGIDALYLTPPGGPQAELATGWSFDGTSGLLSFDVAPETGTLVVAVLAEG